MPATTSDPISSVLQRTFGGLDHKREGLIRGGNSSSAVTTKPFSVDKQLQASAKHGLVTSDNMDNSISFDAPTSYKSENPANLPKVIILNPGASVSQQNQNNHASNNSSGDASSNNVRKEVSEQPKEGIPQAKIVLFNPSGIQVGYGGHKRVAGAGMANAGNTCYLNSTLQALFHIPALYNYLTTTCINQHLPKCNSGMASNGFFQTCTICALVQTLRDSLKSSVIRPNRIYEKLKIICKHMVQGRQEDAHEFLRYLTDSLQRSYLNSVPGSKKLDAVSKETTPFNQIFGGYIRQEVTCIRCKHVSTTFQHFMDILVDIQHANSIVEALGHFFRPRKLGYPGDEASLYKCEKCKVKVQAKLQCFLERPPAVLCVQLKRFSLLGGKIGKPIQLTRDLDIKPFLKTAVNDPRGVQYTLRSMITHIGPSPNCGHYTAIGEANNGQFYQFDDASVRPIQQQQVLRTASYVVFYEMTPACWASQVARRSNGRPAPSATVTSSQQQQPQPARFPQKPPIGPRMIPASGSPRASPSLQPKIINRLGVVSTAAKNMVSNAINDITKSVAGGSGNNKQQSSSKVGLVPYDVENDSSEDENSSNAKKHQALNKPSFVPRAITMKNLVEKPVKALEKPVKALSATARNWTVTDVDHHNPSVHSDNSTGSTTNPWVVTNNVPRPASAMSSSTNEDASSTKSSSKWTVTNLKKAIDEEPTGKMGVASSSSSYSTSSGASGTSTPSSAASSCKDSEKADARLNISPRKRPSLDESTSDYDDELDRGRTKKVKKFNNESSSNGSRYYSNGDNNPFQKHQDWQNRPKMSNGQHYSNGKHYHNSYHNNSHRDRYSNGHHGHKPYQNNRDNSFNGGHRRKSFGGGGGNGSFRDSRDKYYHHSGNGSHYYRDNKRYSSSGHHESNHYRDNFHRRSSR